MAYDGIKESLTQQLAKKIIYSIYDSSWDIEDDQIKTRIVRIVDYYLPGNTADNPLYRTASLSDISKAINNIHVMLGGLEKSDYSCMQVTEEALNFFYTDRDTHFGYVNPISEDKWMLAQWPLQIFGTGRHWIYVCYEYRDRKEAEELFKRIPGTNVEYPCKVGKTEKKNPEERVNEDVKKGLYEDYPIIALLLRVDDEGNFEKVIHEILKHWDKHINDGSKKGQEWFQTTPETVFEIYKHISEIW